jgi:hypothetical protein
MAYLRRTSPGAKLSLVIWGTAEKDDETGVAEAKREFDLFCGGSFGRPLAFVPTGGFVPTAGFQQSQQCRSKVDCVQSFVPAGFTATTTTLQGLYARAPITGRTRMRATR